MKKFLFLILVLVPFVAFGANNTPIIQTNTPSNPPLKWGVAMGHSLVDEWSLTVNHYDLWPSQLENLLTRLGYSVGMRNAGKSGNTSLNILNRFQNEVMTWGDAPRVPEFVFLQMAENDPGNGITTATTTTNIETAIEWLKFGCSGFVATETVLPATEQIGIRYVVQTDNGANGGPLLPTGVPGSATITGSATSAINVWECRYSGIAGTNGWARIATKSTVADRCSHIGVISAPYLNYGDNSGDTLATAYAAYDAVTGVRKAESDAVAHQVTGNANVIYIDLYTFLRNRIVAGVSDVQADRRTLIAPANQHLSVYGHAVETLCLYGYMRTNWNVKLPTSTTIASPDFLQ